MNVRDFKGANDSPELLRVHQEWIDAELRGDVELLLNLCTDDIQFLVPGAELVAGKAAVRAFVERNESQVLSIDTADVHFEVGKNLAFKTCRFTTRLALPERGVSEAKVSGIHAWLLRQVKGTWLVSYVTWQYDSDTKGATVTIRLATLADAESISALIAPLAEKYIAHEFSEEGYRTLLDSMTPDAIRGYIAKGFRYHVAEESGGVVGVVATRDNSHLYHLLVAERSQGRGLARELWQVARQACREAGNPGEFTVNSSRFAVGLYEKLGFKREGEDIRAGVVTIAMRLREGAKRNT